MVDCIHFVERGRACLSGCAPKTLFVVPTCVLVAPRKDRRTPAGCLVQQPHPKRGDKPQGPPNQLVPR